MEMPRIICVPTANPPRTKDQGGLLGSMAWRLLPFAGDVPAVAMHARGLRGRKGGWERRERRLNKRVWKGAWQSKSEQASGERAGERAESERASGKRASERAEQQATATGNRYQYAGACCVLRRRAQASERFEIVNCLAAISFAEERHSV